MISWDYSGEWSLQYRLGYTALYRSSCLETLNRNEEKDLLNEGIVFCKDLKNNSRINYLLPENKREDIIQEIEFLTG